MKVLKTFEAHFFNLDVFMIKSKNQINYKILFK